MIRDEDKAALASLASLAADLGLGLLLIGAEARVVQFDERYDVAGGRATGDWDFGVNVTDWAQYDSLLAALERVPGQGFTRRAEHRIVAGDRGRPIDLVPFGGVERADGTIEWPESSKVMTVDGFKEALSHSEEALLHGVPVQVVTLPALLGLKLLAHGDRGAERDLIDVDMVLRGYADSAGDDRVLEEYGDEYALDEEGELEFDQAGARCLGRQMAVVFEERTKTRIGAVLDLLLARGDDSLLTRLIPRATDDWDKANEAVRARFRRLHEGLLAPAIVRERTR